MPKTRIELIGLFSSDPQSYRCGKLETAFSDLGVKAVQVLPWKITRYCSRNRHEIKMDDLDLTSLDALLILDLGARDMGTFFNRVGLLFALQELEVEVINPVNSILQMRNKAETFRKLIAANLPVPETLITESIEEAAEFVKQHFPCVIKPISGFGGAGVHLIEKDFDRIHILDYLKFYSQLSGHGAFLLQQYIKGCGFDIRALVVKNQVVATMQRVKSRGFVTNIHAGGKARTNDIDVEHIAIRAAKAVHGVIVGVDIIPDQTGNLWILEVNATPGWAGLQTVTEFDVTSRIAELLLKR